MLASLGNFLEYPAADQLFSMKNQPILVGIISIEQCHVMNGSDVLAAVSDWLLRHAKMHQIWTEVIEKGFETKLFS